MVNHTVKKRYISFLFFFILTISCILNFWPIHSAAALNDQNNTASIKALNNTVSQVKKMIDEEKSIDEIASTVTQIVDNRVINVNSFERLKDWRNWFLIFADNPKEKEFDDFRAQSTFDYEKIAEWVWNSQYGQCEEISNLTYYIMKKAGIKENVRILSTSAGSGHNFVVWGMKKGANPNDPATWGDDARVIDGWGGNTFNSKQAKNDSLYYQEDAYITDSTCSYDKNAVAWVKQNKNSTNASSLFDCLFTSVLKDFPDAKKKISVLRDFRDEVLLSTWWGEKITVLYYRLSPPLACYLDKHEKFQTIVRNILIEPLVGYIQLSKH